MKLDLRPFGINHTLDSKDPLPTFSVHLFAYANNTKEGGKETFHMGGKTYTEIAYQGSGSYGAAYLVADKDGNQSVIKALKGNLSTTTDVNIFVRESIIHLLLAKESAGEVNGPYVPEFYELGYDPATKIGFLRIQAMYKRVDKLLYEMDPEKNDIVVPDMLKQLAHILKFFGEKLAFNHRDMKGDNVMYIKKNPAHYDRLYKLIDFGMACLTWHGLQIKGGAYFRASDPCFKKDRDLSQFIYYLVEFHNKMMSPTLVAHLSKMLLANVGPAKSCNMPSHCPIHGLKKNWVSVYNFLDRHNVFVPAGVPNVVSVEMNRFRTGLPFEGVPCLEGEERNPKTRRCVTRRKPRAAAAGAAGKTRKNAAAPISCPPDKILNPASGKCVKQDGAIGKKLLEAAAVAAPAIPAIPAPKATKKCPPGEIRNPASGRCVSVHGKIGKMLLR